MEKSYTLPSSAAKKYFLLITLLIMATCSKMLATVSITAPTLTINTCSLYPTNYHSLGNIVITEGANGDFAVGTNVTLILTAPANYQFLAGTGSVAISAAPTNLSGESITVTATTITVTYTSGGTNRSDVMTISGIQVRCVTGPVTQTVTKTGGTGTITGLTNGTTVATLISNTVASPVGGTAISSSVSPICNNVATVLSVTGGTDGTAFQWQSSPDNITFTNIATSSTSSTYTYTPTATGSVYFRRIVTCGTSANSSSVLVTSQVCDCSTGGCSAITINVDLSASPDTTYVLTSQIRNGLCCLQTGTKCIRFNIIVNPLSDLINFQVATPAPPGGATYQIDCGAAYSLGTPACISGGTHCIVFCKSGGDSPTYTIIATRTINASADITVREGCPGTLSVTGLQPASIAWTSINPGAAGAYNSYLSCISGCATTTVTPAVGSPSFIDYMVTGTPNTSCTGTSRDTIRVNIVPGMTAAITPIAPVLCSAGPGSITLTATPTGGAPAYTYLWSTGETTQSISVNTIGTYTVDVSDATASCPPIQTTVTVIANPTPAAPTAPGVTICTGSAAILTATAPGGTYEWYSAASGGTLLATAASYTTPVLAANTTYYVQTTSGGCTSPRTAVTVTVSPIPAAPTAPGTTICQGTAAIITATAPGGTYDWYDASSGGTLLSTGASYTTPILIVNTTYYVQTTVSGCAGPRTAVTVTVTPTPVAPTASGTTICEGQTATLTATAPGGTYQWYDAASGGTLLATAASYTTPALSVTTTYYVQTTVSGCPGPRTAVTVTITPIPVAPTASGTTICTGTTTTLTATAPGGTYAWYNASTGGTLLITNASYTTPVLAATTTYYVQTTVSGCAGPRTAVTVIVSPVPAAPTAAGAAICTGTSTILTATAPGGTYQWYDAASGGTLLTTAASYTTPVLAATTTYYVQTTVSGCAGPRTAVTVTVSPVPAAPTAAGASICSGNSATLTATAPGGTYSWYDAASGGTLLITSASYTTPALTSTTTYYVQTSVAGCTGPRTAVTVTINSVPVAPTALGTTICQGTTATITATAPGGTYAWYDAASGGTLLITNASYTTPALSATTTYYVQSTAGACTGPRTAVTVTVTPTPAAPTAAGTTICQGTAATITATAPGGTYAWYDAASGGTLLVTAASYTTPVLAATTTYYVQTTISGCTGPRTAVTVTVTPTPSAPTAAGATICQGTSTTITATAPGGAYAWYTAASGGTLLVTAASYTTPVLNITTTYYVQTTISGCVGPRTAVVVTVTPIPAAPTASGTTICQGTTATLTATAPGGTYEWYSAAAGGTLLATNASYTTPALSVNTTYYVQTTVSGCTGPRTAVTVTITPTPAAPTAVGATICTGSSTTLTATAPGGTYAWYDAATGGTLLVTNASYTTPVLTLTTTYYVQTTVSGCAGPRTAVIVTVSPVPAAPTASGASICTGTSTALTATAPGGTYQWYNAASGGTLLATTANYTTPVLAATTTYYVQTTVAGCAGPRTAVTVTVSPVPAAPTASGAIICSGNTATLTATAPGGTYDWYSAATGGTLLATNSSYTTPILTTTTTYYVQTTIAGCSGPRTAVTVTVNPIPVAPTAAGAIICQGTTATLTATAPGGTYAWYDAASGGTLLVTNATYTTPALTTTTTFYVQTTISGCTGPRGAVVVTVNPTPAAPSVSGTTICQGTTAILTATAPGGTYDWYDAASGGTLLATGTSFTTPSLTTTTTYYVQSTISGCPGPRTSVTVTVTPTPAAPTAAGTTICSGSTTTLTAIAPGGTYEWYNAATGGTLLVTNASYTTPALTTSTTYYVQTTISGCTGPRTAVVVTVNPIPAAPTAANATICAGSTATLTATAPGGSYQWYDAASGGTLLASAASYVTPALANTTVFYVQTTIGGCTSPRTAVTVVVNPIPAAPTAAGTTICQGTTATLTATAPGGTYRWYPVPTGGTALAVSATYTTPVLNVTTTYYVQTTVGGCISPRTAVTVTVTPTPAAPTAAGTTICEGNTATLSATAPGGAYEWYDAITGGILLAANASYTTPTLTTTTTYYVQTTISGCSSTRTAVTVTVNPTDNPSFNYASGTYCITGTNPTPTITGGFAGTFSSSPAGLVFTNVNTGTINLSVSSLNTYSVTFTTSGSCPAFSIANITITNAPSAVFSYATPYCQNDANAVPSFGAGASAGVFTSTPAGLTFVSAGTGEINLAATTPGTYTVTNNIVAAGGCAAAMATSSITINISPQVNAGNNQTICEGTTATMVATIGGSATSGIWSGGTGSFSSSTSLTAIYTPGAGETTATLILTTNDPAGPCISITDTIVITITPTPTAPTVTDATICAGNSVTLTATAPGGIYEWYDAVSGGTLLATNASYTTPLLTTTTIYYVQTTISSCAGPRTSVTVTVNPIPAAPSASGTSICAGSTATLTATAPGGSYDWYDAAAGGTLLMTGGTYTTPALTSSITYYVQSTISGCTSPRTAVTVTVNPIPAAPTASNITICNGNTGTITATAPGGAYQWYDASSGGTLLASTTGYTTPPLTAATTYYVQTTIAGCTGPRTAVTVNVNPVPVAPTVLGTTICQGTTTILSATAPGGTYRWYPVPTGGSLLFTGANYTTPILNSTTTYYVQTTVGGCISPRTAVTVTVTPTPAAPTASGTTICSGNTATLNATAPGGTYAWYDAATGGTLLVTNASYTTPSLTSTTTYFVQTTVSGCASTRTTVTVTVNPIENSSFSYSSGTYCFTGTNPIPTITGASGTFSSSPAGLVFVNSATGEINLGASSLNTYSVTYTTNGTCFSSNVVNVTITNAPSAAFTYNTPYCQNGSNPVPSFGIGASAGIFSTSMAGLTFANITTGEINMGLSVPGTYTVTNDIAAAGGCASATASSSITIDPSPTVNAGPNRLICGSGTTTLAGSIGGSATSATWSGGTGTFSNSSSLTPVYTPGAGETSAILVLTTNDPAGPCSAVSDTMIVTVNPIPSAPTASGTTICEGTTATLTATAPGGIYQWYIAPTGGTALASGINYTTPVLFATTTYYVQTSIGGCAGPRTAVTVIVTPTENSTFNYSSGTFCITGSNPSPTVAAGVTGTFSASPAGLVFINAATGEINLAASTLNTYAVTFTSDGACPSASTVNVTITTAPNASFSYSGPYCPSETNPSPAFPIGASAGVFSASPAGLNFVSTSTGEINVSTSSPGTYTITNDIAAAGGCAAATSTSTITIDMLPIVNANSDQTVCAGVSATLAGIIGGSATSATWTGGTGSFSSNSDPNAIYTPASGEASVTLILTTNDPAGSCNAVTDSMMITFQSDTSAFSYSSSAYCSSGANPTPFITGGYSGTFSSSPAGLVFVSTTTGEINLSASTLNTYSVTFTTNGICPNSTSINVSVTNGFDATFSYSGPYCQSDANPIIVLGPIANSGVFSSSPVGLNFVSSSTGEIDLMNTIPGTYLITNFIAPSGGCASATANATVVIDPAAIVNAGNNISTCVGSAVTLAGTMSGSATTATWSGGLGSFSSNTDLNAVYTPAVGETSAVLVLTTNDPAGPCGTASDSMVITINPIPAAPTASDTTICSGESTILTATSPGGTYQWYDAPGGTLLITNASYSTPALTSSTIYYVQTTVSGCTSPQTAVTVTVNPPAIVDAGTDQTICGNNPNVTLSGTVTNVSGGIWSTSGAGTFSPNDSSLTASYTPASSDIAADSVILILTSYGSCAAVTDSMTLIFSPSPSVNAGADQFICTGTLSATLNGAVTGGAATGQWTTLGDGSFAMNDTMLNATYNLGSADTASGVVMLILTSTNNGTCLSVSDTMEISITTIPMTSAGNDTIVCGNDPSVQLNGTITGGSGMGIWTSSGTGVFTPSDSVLNAIYVPSALDITNGNVVLTLTPFNSCLPIQDSLTVTITTPTIVNAGNDLTVCSTVSNVILTGTVSGGTSTGTWTTQGDGTFSPSADSLNAMYTFGIADTTAGTITMILTSTNNGNCSAITDTMQIMIITNPIINAGNDTIVCGNSPDIQLNGNVSVGQGIWTSNGTGVFTPSDSVLNAIYNPSAADIATGNVVLTLTPFNSCIPVSDSLILTITPPTIVNAGNNITVCSSVTDINLNGLISGGTATGTWTTSGSGTFSPSVDSLTATYTFSSVDTTAGSVVLLLTSTNNGTCMAISDSVLITFSNSTSAFAGNDTTVCANNSDAVLNGIITGGTAAVWTSTGTGTFTPSDSVLNATYTPSASDIAAGNIILILTPGSTCSSIPDSLLLMITPAPVVNAGKDTTICGGAAGIILAGTVDAVAAGGFWTTNGTGSFSPNDSTLNATYIPGIADNDTLVFILTSYGNGLCNAVSDTVVVLLNVQPDAAFSTSNMCAGQSVLFTDNSNANGGTITNWSWSFGSGGANSTLQNPTFAYPSTGNYNVTLIVSSGSGCADSITQVININPVPAASFTFTENCENAPVTFTNASTISSGNILSWNWNFGDGNSSAIQNSTNVFDSSGVYNIVLTVTSDSGCTASITKPVTINPLPAAGFTSASDCGSASVVFTDTSSVSSGSISSYSWSFGDGGTSSAEDPTYLYSNSGSYNVTLIVVTNNGCSDTSITSVTPGSAVIAEYIPHGGSYNVSQSVIFDNQSTGGITYSWNFADGSAIINETDPAHGFTSPGTYSVELTVSNSSGCSDTISYDFVITSSGSAIPTGFTPNNDGLNDLFSVIGNFSSYELRVFNEWGNQIFMSTDQANKWDGTYKGKEQPAGTYIYIFNGKIIDGTELKMNGEVNLIR